MSSPRARAYGVVSNFKLNFLVVELTLGYMK